MLVARRDPFHPGAHDDSFPHAAASPQHSGSGFSRALTVLQMVGALLAIPIGIGSAYTMYQSTFSPEATCKALRVNIVRMLDKNVDAGARHMLVRRDVEAFKQTCGAVDPDATAAFKALLAADKVAPLATAPVQPAQPQLATRKAEPAAPAKPAQAPARTVAAAPAQHDTRDADAAWVAAVRGALVKHERDTVTAAVPSTSAPVSLAPPPRSLGELPAVQPAPVPQALPPLAPAAVAPALPPPAEVGSNSAPQADGDHPVPPSAIPEQQESKKRSRIGALVEDIPFFGKSLADRMSR